MRQQAAANKDDQSDSVSFLNSAIFAVLVLILVAGLSLNRIAEPDLFWQIRCGNDILVHGAPHHDIYSWTRYGASWNVNEWCAFALFAWFYDFANGFFGVFLLMELLISAVGLTVYLILLSQTKSPLISFVLCALSFTSITDFLLARPYLFTFTFLAINVYVVKQVAAEKIRALWLAALIPLTVIWTNLHQGDVVGVSFTVFFGMWTVVESVLKIKDSTGKATRKYYQLGYLTFATGILQFCATLCSPYGIGLYKFIWITIADSKAMSAVSEWTPIPIVLAPWCVASVILFVGICVAVVVYWKHELVNIGELAFAVGCTGEALLHQRNLPLSVIVTIILFSPLLARLLNDLSGAAALKSSIWRSRRHHSLHLIAVGLCAAYAVAILREGCLDVADAPIMSTSPTEQVAAAAFGIETLPIDAVRFMNSAQFDAGMRFYNEYNEGGLLIFGRPTDGVFVDGRNDVYTGSFLDTYISTIEAARFEKQLSSDGANFLNQFGFDCALVTIPAVAKYFASRPDYVLVFVRRALPISDAGQSNCWIFVHRLPKYLSLIARSRQLWAIHNKGQMPSI